MSDTSTSSPSREPLGQRTVALSPQRALWALLEQSDARAKVRALSSVELNRRVAELGLYDAHELLALASGEQLREVVDMQVWIGDRLDSEELLDWAASLARVEREASDGDAQPLQALDVELVGWLLRTQCDIYLVREDEVPDEPRGVLWPTPDGWFVLDVVTGAHPDDEDEHDGDDAASDGAAEGDSGRAQQLIAVLERMYRDDPDAARKLLQATAWELPSQLEEYAYRWRNGRLADLGFADPLEALGIYAYLDPASVTPDEGSEDRPMASDPEPVGETSLVSAIPGASDSLWSRAVAGLDAETAERLARSAMAVANRTLSADRVPPGDLELARECLEALHWRLNLGLEHLSDGDVTRARAALARVALSRIARVGHSLTLELRQRLLAITRSQRLGARPGRVDYLGAPLADRLPPLLAARPQLFDEARNALRPFGTREDLALAQRWIDETALVARLVPADAIPNDPPETLTLGAIFCTKAINRVLDDRVGPLDQQALERLVRDHMHAGEISPTLRRTLREIAAERLAGSGLEDHPALATVLERWQAQLEAELGSLSPQDIDPRFVGGLYVISDS
ncbi:MAG: hypothetical protein KC503_07560 [Myxococcales bacterium]|nr:hypothetical protein [Myxococcales bacterium]